MSACARHILSVRAKAPKKPTKVMETRRKKLVNMEKKEKNITNPEMKMTRRTSMKAMNIEKSSAPPAPAPEPTGDPTTTTGADDTKN